jgi:hypothetical protein
VPAAIADPGRQQQLVGADRADEQQRCERAQHASDCRSSTGGGDRRPSAGEGERRASPLTFEEIDHAAFPLFGLGAEAGRRGGCAPVVYNASTEVAVGEFLEGRIRFPEMADVVSEALARVGMSEIHSVEDVLSVDREARRVAIEIARRVAA